MLQRTVCQQHCTHAQDCIKRERQWPEGLKGMDGPSQAAIHVVNNAKFTEANILESSRMDRSPKASAQSHASCPLARSDSAIAQDETCNVEAGLS